MLNIYGLYDKNGIYSEIEFRSGEHKFTWRPVSKTRTMVTDKWLMAKYVADNEWATKIACESDDS